jgi:hypothetical protein
MERSLVVLDIRAHLIEGPGTRKRGLERETGFEPATDGLGSRCATTALLPPLRRGIIR